LRLVMKFGGSVLRDGAGVLKAARVVGRHLARGEGVVVVTSSIAGVADSLDSFCEHREERTARGREDLLEELRKTHFKASDAAVPRRELLEKAKSELLSLLESLGRDLAAASLLEEVGGRARDTVLSHGERLSAAVFSSALRALNPEKFRARILTGGEAGVVTDEVFGSAHPLQPLTGQGLRRSLQPLLRKGVTPVVTGLIAASRSGAVTTLGRGGSDLTATLIGAALGVDEVWMWSDVEGLMTADPKLVPEAKLIKRISYAEAAEMAGFGAKILHPKSLEPAMQAGIPVRIRSIDNPGSHGTLITAEAKPRRGEVVKAVSCLLDVASITVEGGGMVGVPGVAADVLGSLARRGVNISMISQGSSEVSITLVINGRDLEKALRGLKEDFPEESIVRSVSYEDDISVVNVVGAGMRGTPGVAARVFRAVADEGVNIRIIAQGSSELNISFAVAEKDAIKAVRAVHKAFNPG